MPIYICIRHVSGMRNLSVCISSVSEAPLLLDNVVDLHPSVARFFNDSAVVLPGPCGFNHLHFHGESPVPCMPFLKGSSWLCSWMFCRDVVWMSWYRSVRNWREWVYLSGVICLSNSKLVNLLNIAFVNCQAFMKKNFPVEVGEFIHKSNFQACLWEIVNILPP